MENEVVGLLAEIRDLRQDPAVGREVQRRKERERKLRKTPDTKETPSGMRPLRKMRGTSKATFLSDGGAGVERMVNAIDQYEPSDALAKFHARKLHAAEMRLYRAGLGYLVPILRLIAKNRDNRKASIARLQKRHAASWNAAKRLYFSRLKILSNFFLAH